MPTAKNFTDLATIYKNNVLGANTNIVTEGVDKGTVGKMGEIGDIKMGVGGNDKAKKDIKKPKEAKTENGEPKDADKSVAQKPLSQKLAVNEQSMHKTKTIFDEVYRSIVEETDEGDGLDDGNEFDLLPPDEDGDDDFDGTEKDPAEIIKSICKLVSQLKDAYGISDEADDIDDADTEVGDDLGDGIDTDSEDINDIPLKGTVGESVNGKPTKVSLNNKLQQMKNTIGKIVASKKKARTDITTGNGKPTKIGSVAKLAGNKSVRVAGNSSAVRGGNACAFGS